jgi:histidinol-phosphate aminotransferase
MNMEMTMSRVDLEKFLRRSVRSLEPYTPIVPYEVLSERLSRRHDEIIKLDANENPYGPVPGVRVALAELDFPHIYPDPENRALSSALAEYTGVPFSNIFVGAGADELIDLIMRLFLDPGDKILDCPPTFGMYAFDASILAAETISVPRRSDFSLDITAIETAVAQHAPKLLFLASPNNPDGSLLPETDLLRLLELQLIVVLDEAYIEFARGECSRIEWVLQHSNLIVLRTFSKWAGLAGLRVGYGVFPSELMPQLWKTKQPYNVNVAATAAALTTLHEREQQLEIVACMVRERRRMERLLDEIMFLQVYPSQANFVLCRVNGRSARELHETLEGEGILVRYFDKPILRDHIRVSVGRPEHTDALITVLTRLAGH